MAALLRQWHAVPGLMRRASPRSAGEVGVSSCCCSSSSLCAPPVVPSSLRGSRSSSAALHSLLHTPRLGTYVRVQHATGRGHASLSDSVLPHEPPARSHTPAPAPAVANDDIHAAAVAECLYEPSSASFSALTAEDRAVLIDAVRKLYANKDLIAAAEREHCISENLFPQVVGRLRRKLVTAPASLFHDSLPAFYAFIKQCAVADKNSDYRDLFLLHRVLPLVASVAEETFGEQLAAARVMRQCADLRQPHTWYPRARRLKRRIIFHAGPTNSGKTYHALRALKDAHSGLYCGPLRLLALEVYESMNLDGVPASLLTGQERRDIPFARHKACTVEMMDVYTPVDVAVIDEIQMIGDRQRGSAWTRAFLGVVAPEVHVCGDPAALPVLTSLVALCGDALEVQWYDRLTPLTPLPTSLNADYGRVEEGDCIVAFSRKDVYAIRKLVERKTAHKCCVVYGSLPPETRSQQARLFNDPASGFRVLVASDAIGMGLNLNIRRVVFHSMDKFDGDSLGPVQPAAVKQIAGRAGRRSSQYAHGLATTLQESDLPYLHECLATPSAPITHAGLFPNAEQLSRFAALLPADTPFATLIEKFVLASHLDGPYFMCRDTTIKMVAQLLQPFNLTLTQRAALCLAPVNLRTLPVRQFFLTYLEDYTSGVPVRLRLQLPINDPSYLIRDLEALEAKVHALDVYMWLGQRLGVFSFPDLEEAATKRITAAQMLEEALTVMSDETKTTWERNLAAKKERYAAEGARKRARLLAAERGETLPPEDAAAATAASTTSDALRSMIGRATLSSSSSGSRNNSDAMAAVSSLA